MSEAYGAADYRSMLGAIDPAPLTYDEWFRVGCAAKTAGLDCADWDAWSRRDPERYEAGLCAKKWAGIGESGGVGPGTLVHMAREAGWERPRGGGHPPSCCVERAPLGDEERRETGGTEDLRADLEPDDLPARDLGQFAGMPEAQQLAVWLDAVYGDGTPHSAHGTVCVVTQARQDERTGKWQPASRGVNHDAAKLRAALDDPGATVAGALGQEVNPAAGAWACVNPTDGGRRDESVTDFRNLLVESDEGMTEEEQRRAIATLQLPVRALTWSGGKSLHAIVAVDASDNDEYRERAHRTYALCDANGLPTDHADRNPSRLTRIPGVGRGDDSQRLVYAARYPGAGAWAGWDESTSRAVRARRRRESGVVTLADVLANPPAPEPELIHDVLRRGRKLMLTGPSKAGKTTCLLALAYAVASGGEWLGHRCERGRVLYVNLEVAGYDMYRKYADLRDAARGDGRPLADEDLRRVDMLTLAGVKDGGKPISDMGEVSAKVLDLYARDDAPALVIVDPVYKVIGGDENKAEDVSAFLAWIDSLIGELGCSVAYVHHHAKGFAGDRATMDRGSGSGVWARDPDAMLDLTPIFPAGDDAALTWLQNMGGGHGAYPYELSYVLRSFAQPKPKRLAFAYPSWIVAENGELDGCETDPRKARQSEGRVRGGRGNAERCEGERAAKIERIDGAIARCAQDGVAPTEAAVWERFNGSGGAVKLDTFSKWMRTNSQYPFHVNEDGEIERDDQARTDAA